MIRVLVTVSRSFREISTMREVLEKIHATYPGALLVHGDDPGSDHKARGIWRGLGGMDEPWRAKWADCAADCPPRKHRKIRRKTGEEYCPGAGIRRSTAMVESAPHMVVAFLDPKSKTRGAFRCAQAAEDAGIPVVRYEQSAGAP
jgi:hypothetical protein